MCNGILPIVEKKNIASKTFTFLQADHKKMYYLKGTVSRDFLLQVFFMNHLPPSP